MPIAQVRLKVTRQEPGPVPAPSERAYTLEVDDDATVMDALLQVRDQQDGSLAFRANCLRGFCGDCAYRINGGDGRLACTVPVAGAVKNGDIRIEPIPQTSVIKDLVYDLEPSLWKKIRAVRPAIAGDPTPSTEERAISPALVEDLQTVMSCVMCGLCDSGCTVIAVDGTFLGPAALTKAYRAIKDPRDTRMKERLRMMDMSHGVWDCTHCFEANGHCPKKINPTFRIFAIRDMLIKEGIQNKQVARHHDSFLASVKAKGTLDEGRLAVESIGWTNIAGLIKFLPTALTALRRGKAPIPYLHKKKAGAEQVRRIIEHAEKRK